MKLFIAIFASLLWFMPLGVHAGAIVLQFRINGPDCEHVNIMDDQMNVLTVTTIEELFPKPTREQNLAVAKAIDPLVFQVRKVIFDLGLEEPGLKDEQLIKLEIGSKDFHYYESSVRGRR